MITTPLVVGEWEGEFRERALYHLGQRLATEPLKSLFGEYLITWEVRGREEDWYAGDLAAVTSTTPSERRNEKRVGRRWPLLKRHFLRLYSQERERALLVKVWPRSEEQELREKRLGGLLDYELGLLLAKKKGSAELPRRELKKRKGISPFSTGHDLYYSWEAIENARSLAGEKGRRAQEARLRAFQYAGLEQRLQEHLRELRKSEEAMIGGRLLARELLRTQLLRGGEASRGDSGMSEEKRCSELLENAKKGERSGYELLPATLAVINEALSLFSHIKGWEATRKERSEALLLFTNYWEAMEELAGSTGFADPNVLLKRVHPERYACHWRLEGKVRGCFFTNAIREYAEKIAVLARAHRADRGAALGAPTSGQERLAGSG